MDAVLSRQHMDTGPLGVSRGVGYGSLRPVGWKEGPLWIRLALTRPMDASTRPPNSQCDPAFVGDPGTSLIPWRSHCGSQLALTPRSLDTGPPRVSRDV